MHHMVLERWLPGTLACGADDVLGARRISDLTWRSVFGTSMTQSSCALLEEIALESGKSVDWG